MFPYAITRTKKNHSPAVSEAEHNQAYFVAKVADRFSNGHSDGLAETPDVVAVVYSLSDTRRD